MNTLKVKFEQKFGEVFIPDNAKTVGECLSFQKLHDICKKKFSKYKAQYNNLEEFVSITIDSLNSNTIPVFLCNSKKEAQWK